MSCGTDKFVINKGVDNEFVLTIKQTGTTLPMEINNTDTFEAHLIKLNDGTTILTKLLSIEDTANGKVKLVVSSAEAGVLESSKGSEVDRYYLRPTYRLMIDCNTVNNGAFIAKVPEVYVE